MKLPPPAVGEPPAPIDLGVPGASARRMHDTRRANRQARLRRASPLLGGLRARFQDAPRHEEAWGVGAEGEERVAAVLARRAGSRVIVLHDRAVPGSRANIDHIAVAPSGVWVIDSKRYRGAAKVVRARGAEPRLVIGGRDGEKLVVALLRQRELVRRTVEALLPGVAVEAMLCFVDTELPPRRDRVISGVGLASPREAAKLVRQRGTGTAAQVDALARALVERFPRA